ncbi:cytospin-A-like [Dendropsophus ebraccatus]|uniref:cytospin-A-like n=1 Tax=Dendropsophus ebraccatus TaxID=150705 RepID=UPI00383211FD
MGGNSVKNAPDVQSDPAMGLASPSVYKSHQSPPTSPTPDTFYTPMGSPDTRPIPMDTGPSPEELSSLQDEPESLEGWGAPFGRAMKRIQKTSYTLDEMHSQLRGLLTPGSSSEGHRILESALGWEARLTEVRRDLKSGLRELSDLRRQYESLSAGPGMESRKPSELQEHIRALESEDRIERERLRDRVYHLEKENGKLTERVLELQGEVQDLNLLQSDLRTAVAVAERFREEAQEKLEISERENQRLRGKGSDTVDWADTSPINGSLQGYRSLPRGVILSSMREPILKSSSLMSVPPGSSLLPHTEATSSCKERRGSLETLLNQSKATENLTEDSGSFFRRYGGSKRGVFLRWAQDRTCGYKHVVITNFSTSWVDGMALCALLHSYLPQSIPYSQLRPLEKRKNLQLAFQVAESVGIPPLLTIDHLLQTQGPDWQKVLLYVESIYQKFEA